MKWLRLEIQTQAISLTILKKRPRPAKRVVKNPVEILPMTPKKLLKPAKKVAKAQAAAAANE